MHKVHIVSSLLVAFGLSIFSMGCDPAKKPATNPVKKVTGPGSTTGGGTEVPAAAAGGTTEKPEAKPEVKPAEEKTEANPEEKSAEVNKADDKPAEEKKSEDK